MELTVTYHCMNPECHREEQMDTIKIRRGQRITLKCGFCEEPLVEIQANKKPTRHRTLCERCTTNEPELRKTCTASCEEHDRERTPQTK